MKWYIAFFFAGWFSAVIGFEVGPLWSHVAGFVSFAALIILRLYLAKEPESSRNDA